MAITRKHSTSANLGTGPYGLTYTSAAAVGDLLVACIRSGSSSDDLTSVADSVNAGNWTRLAHVPAPGTNASVYMYVHIASSAGTPIVTPVFSGTPTCRMSIHCYGGNWDGTAVDQGAGNAGTSTTPDSGNITTSVADTLIVGVIGCALDLGASTFTNGSTLTQQHQITGAAFTSLDRIATSTETLNADGTFDVSDRWAALIVSFKEAVLPGISLPLISRRMNPNLRM